VAEAVGVDPSPVFVAKAGDLDPLQDCIEALKAEFVNDPWLVRRLPVLLRSVGFGLHGSRSHGYLQTDSLSTC
jgi:hypothetical protein